MSIEVGQKLWYVGNRRGSEPRWVEVSKVGRKWIETERGLRFDIATLNADGGQYTSPGRAWITQEAHAYAVEKNRRWSEFRTMVERSWHCPDGIEVEDINELERKLKPARSA
jgi:hypothetical protein